MGAHACGIPVHQRPSLDADLQQICWWHNDAVVPFDKWLCWIDYHRGILLCDMSKLPNHHPTVSYIWFPLDKLPDSGTSCWASTSFFRAVSVVDHGRVLKFVNVTRHDGIHFAPLQPGTGFTITCHTLVVLDSGGMAWEEDYTVTSGELWEANSPDRLPRHILMFPQVDMDRPRVAHFLSIEFGIGYVKRNKKMWVVSIDMSTKTVESISLYINGDEGLETGDAEFIKIKSDETLPFIPCEFPKFLHSSRYGRNVAAALPFYL
ncbi:hypothetical protein HU200_011862 [Digitaria exilis]|uniref:DUF1618 domain-containing protein n=1 Tax=Digitaria exilis TaxID=1010633 RepID=A0A835EC77_9POAL|nr:hypothetical protein HU200_046807 [Digitaria exilis]KAF8752744.1 hypothetical protein HU200_011862 [Digitaria exilis]